MSEKRPLTGRTIVVTGGTGGIGKATAMGLAALGAHVGIVGRDRARLASAADDLRLGSANDEIDVFEADLSSQAQVRRLAAELRERYPRLDVLVNNVGGLWAHRHVTEDGLELTFALNHLAPFLLTHLLLDRMVALDGARIVTIASSAEAFGRIDFDDLQSTKAYSGQRAYNQSKLANVLFTYELARRLNDTQVTANAVHPGVTRTAFGVADQPKAYRDELDGASVHALPRAGRRHGRLGGLIAGARRRDGWVLPRSSRQAIVGALARRVDGEATLAGQRGVGRHLRMTRQRTSDHPCTSPSEKTLNFSVQCCTLNHMVQQQVLDRAFAALADETRRGILTRLGDGPATITELAMPTGMTLTGIRKHVDVLEAAGLVTTEKVGRVRQCRLGTERLDDAMAWISFYQRLWERRLDGLEAYFTLHPESTHDTKGTES